MFEQQQQQLLENEQTSPEKNSKDLIPCSIVVSNFDEATIETTATTISTTTIIDNQDEKCDNVAAVAISHRQSIISNSSLESARSDNNNCDEVEEGVNIEHGSSVFYVIWD